MDYDQIRQRIRKLRGKTPQREVARRLGCSVAWVSQLERGTRHPSLDLLAKLARMWGVPLGWLLTGDETEATPSKSSQSIDIPLVSDAVAAGLPIVPYDEVEGVISIPKKMLRGLNPKKLCAVKVAGDSMEPILKEGYVVVVDREKRPLEDLNGKIVVARVEEGITVKYLRYDPGFDPKRAYLSPHNAPKYHPLVQSPKDTEDAVIGKVVLILAKPE